MRYPSTREGIPLSPEFINLPPTRFADLPKNKNNHHFCFPAGNYYYSGIIYASLRDIESLQMPLQKDVHNLGKMTLHALYSPPTMPKPTQAIDYLLGAYERGESLQARRGGRLCRIPLNEELMNEILVADYSRAMAYS